MTKTATAEAVFCESLRAVMRLRGMTQGELASHLYIDRSLVSRWLRGKGSGVKGGWARERGQTLLYVWSYISRGAPVTKILLAGLPEGRAAGTEAGIRPKAVRAAKGRGKDGEGNDGGD